MTDLFVAGLVLLALVTAYIAGRLHQALIDVERSNHLPYKVRAGMDDLSAVSTDALLQVRDDLLIIEARLNDHHRIMGEIRQGRYDPEQPAAPRVKRSGDGAGARAARG